MKSIQIPHFDFCKTRDEIWYHNTDFHPLHCTLIARVFFNDSDLLNECSYPARVKVNVDNKIPYAYIADIYATRGTEEAVLRFSCSFEKIRYTTKLENGVLTPESKTYDLSVFEFKSWRYFSPHRPELIPCN